MLHEFLTVYYRLVSRIPFQDALYDMRECAVPDIMKESRKPYLYDFFLRKIQRFCHLICDKKRPNAVLETGMVRTRKSEVGKPKLLDTAEACHLRSTDNELLKFA